MRIAIALLLLILALALPVAAQEPDETPEPTPVVITDDTPVVVVQPDRTGDILAFGGIVLLAIAGGGGIVLVIERITRSKDAADNAERLYLSLSPEWQDTIRAIVEASQRVADVADRLLDFAEVVTDGKPNDDMQTPPA